MHRPFGLKEEKRAYLSKPEKVALDILHDLLAIYRERLHGVSMDIENVSLSYWIHEKAQSAFRFLCDQEVMNRLSHAK